MKRFSYLTSLVSMLLIALLMTSCGGNKKEEQTAEKLGKMELVIPEALADNPEMVAYIEGMTEVVDEYALLIDENVDDFTAFKGKTFEELNMREKIKFTAAGAQVAMKSAPVLTKWAELEMEKSVIGMELSEDELLALETVMTRFEDRMKEIEARHTDFFGEEAVVEAAEEVVEAAEQVEEAAEEATEAAEEVVE